MVVVKKVKVKKVKVYVKVEGGRWKVEGGR